MISQTVEYALRAMARLARLPAEECMSSEAISEEMQIPRDYLSKVMRDLVVAELVSSHRGPNGGFRLTRDPSVVSMLDILRAVDELPRIRACPLGNPDHVKLCPLHQRLDDALAGVECEFARTTLAEIVDTEQASLPLARHATPTRPARDRPKRQSAPTPASPLAPRKAPPAAPPPPAAARRRAK
ncbi:MAG: Rrf2 family transcriptional regulator [Phycisphaerales bacterium]|jgi:Rrf2 family protein|nr:Rrf2 family transcriptional regulator [Phycisphaerales bacterium]